MTSFSEVSKLALHRQVEESGRLATGKNNEKHQLRRAASPPLDLLASNSSHICTLLFSLRPVKILISALEYLKLGQGSPPVSSHVLCTAHCLN